MSEKYKIFDNERPYFITLTVAGWIDLFTRPVYKQTIIDSIKYCQKEKGLELFGYVLMTNHLHLIAGTSGSYSLSEILRDIKKYTSKRLIEQIKEEPESRREWMLQYFANEADRIKRAKNYKVWQDGNHPEIINNNDFFYQKLNYIHWNPVKEMIVETPEDYVYSSARNYADKEFVLEIVLETPKFITYN